MEFLWFILIGLCAGWLASQIMKGGSSGVLQNMIIGVIGAILGGLMFRLIGLGGFGPRRQPGHGHRRRGGADRAVASTQ